MGLFNSLVYTKEKADLQRRDDLVGGVERTPQSLGRGYGSCRTLVRSSRERAAERREALPEKGRPVLKSAGRRAG